MKYILKVGGMVWKGYVGITSFDRKLPRIIMQNCIKCLLGHVDHSQISEKCVT